jgi:hypothetical protein
MYKPLFVRRTLRKMQYYVNCSLNLPDSREQNHNVANWIGIVMRVGVKNVLLQGRTGVHKLLLPSGRNQVNKLRLTKREVWAQSHPETERSGVFRPTPCELQLVDW